MVLKMLKGETNMLSPEKMTLAITPPMDSGKSLIRRQRSGVSMGNHPVNGGK